jgi:hypothetical protein
MEVAFRECVQEAKQRGQTVFGRSTATHLLTTLSA